MSKDRRPEANGSKRNKSRRGLAAMVVAVVALDMRFVLYLHEFRSIKEVGRKCHEQDGAFDQQDY